MQVEDSPSSAIRSCPMNALHDIVQRRSSPVETIWVCDGRFRNVSLPAATSSEVGQGLGTEDIMSRPRDDRCVFGLVSSICVPIDRSSKR